MTENYSGLTYSFSFQFLEGDEAPDPNVDHTDSVERIRKFLEDGEFGQACKLVIKLDGVNFERRRAMPIEEQVMYYLVLLQSYLFNNYVSAVLFFLLHLTLCR